jgi:riboflavin kinase/FMN adenylyltransferase
MLFTDWSDPLPTGPAVLTLGVFDGVHLGHQALLSAARSWAEWQRLPLVAVTFDPHPRQLFEGPDAVPLIQTLPDRVAKLRACGADSVVALRFTREVADLSASEFVAELCAQLTPTLICVGNDFRFGRERCGGVGALRRIGWERGFGVYEMPQVVHGGLRVSSTRVRELLAADEVEAAGRLLRA